MLVLRLLLHLQYCPWRQILQAYGYILRQMIIKIKQCLIFKHYLKINDWDKGVGGFTNVVRKVSDSKEGSTFVTWNKDHAHGRDSA